MRSDAKSPEEYIASLPEDRKAALTKLRNTILENIPEGFAETMNYGMIGYVVPHSIYPAGYHCSPELPLPFINIASQKNFVALYHMGIYSDEKLLNWFKTEYPNYVSTKLDMGKSCIRFKNINRIPYELIGELCTKISVGEWIDFYETAINTNQKNKK